MSDSTDRKPGDPAVSENVLFGVVILAAALLLILSAIVNTHMLSLFSPDHRLGPVTTSLIHRAQLRFLTCGGLLIAAAGVCRKWGVFSRLSNRRTVTNVILMIGALALFIFAADNVLSTQYAPAQITSVFIRDQALGWKLRPNADDSYGGARYVINSKGLRSPHSDYGKPPGTKRILQLGDSATIGNGLPYEGTSACMMEAAFADQLRKEPVEVLNGACDGYSTWQEYEFLKTEGLKYSPDLVTVGFVLNDVTEMFRLRRFGGHGIGGQLAQSKDQGNISDFLLYRVLARSAIYEFLKNKFFKMKFGKDLQAGARKMEELQAQDAVYRHDRPELKQAWNVALENLSNIRQTCTGNGIEMLVVYIPFTFQFGLPDSMAYPQWVLRDFCERNGVHFIDCTPILADEMITNQKGPSYYFKDSIHPSAEGNRVIARAEVDYIEKNGLLGEGN